jgi:hypothetical protein
VRTGRSAEVRDLLGFSAGIGFSTGMRLGGFEPPTRGLEGRRSSTELQALTRGKGIACARDRMAENHQVLAVGRLAAGAEVGGHDGRSAAAVDAWRRRGVHRRQADLTPRRGQ